MSQKNSQHQTQEPPCIPFHVCKIPIEPPHPSTPPRAKALSSMEHLSNIHRTSIEHLTIEHISNIEHLSKSIRIYRTSIENLSKINLSKFYRSSIEHLSKIHRKDRISIECRYNFDRISNVDSLQFCSSPAI